MAIANPEAICSAAELALQRRGNQLLINIIAALCVRGTAGRRLMRILRSRIRHAGGETFVTGWTSRSLAVTPGEYFKRPSPMRYPSAVRLPGAFSAGSGSRSTPPSTTSC